MNDGVEAAEEHPAGESRRAGARRPVAPRRRPPPQRGAKGQAARVIVLVATLGLLGVGVAVVLTVTRDNGRSAAKQSFAPTATATPTAAAKRRTAKGAPALPLTNAQKASRNAAIDQMRSQGFEPVATSTYDPRQSLRVLIGRPKASSTGVRGRRAFFFVREQYIGTDSASPSLRLKVAGQKGGQITLAYTRFAAGDKACCPSDGTVKVRFRLDGSRLAPLDPIPPAAARLPPA